MSLCGIPSWLFYEEKQESAQYTSVETGIWDVNEFIQGQPDYWITEEAPNLKKTTLFISDFTIGGWQSYRIRELQAILCKLLDAGFTIYYPARDACLLTKNNLDKIKFIADPTLQPDLTTALSLKGITGSELVELNYLKTRKLIADFTGKFSLDEIEVIDCTDLIKRQALFEVMPPKKTLRYLKANTINLSVATDKIEFEPTFRETYTQIEFTKKVKYLVVENPNNFISLCNHLTDNNRIEYISICYEQYIYPETTGIFDSEMWTQLSSFRYHLKSIALGSLKWRKDATTLGSFSFEKVEELKLVSCALSQPQFYMMLKSVPKLKCLLLYDCKLLDSAWPLHSQIVFENLEELSISCSEISPEALMTILTNSPNLRRLTLSVDDSNMPSFDFEKSPQFKFNKLESIELNHSWAELVVQLLAGSPKLKHLEIVLIKWEKLNIEVFQGLQFCFDHLETSEFDTNIAPEIGIKILAAQRLQKLDFGQYDFLQFVTPAMLHKLKFNWHALKEIYFSYTIQSEVFIELLSQAPNVERITSGFSFKIPDTISIEALKAVHFNFKHLTELYLNVPSDLLVRILENARGIKTLSQFICQRLKDVSPEIIGITEFNMDSLEIIEDPKAIGNPNLLLKMIASSRKIAKIDSQLTFALRDVAPELINNTSFKMHSLETFYTGSNAQLITKILESSTQLKSLDFRLCTGLSLSKINDIQCNWGELKYLYVNNSTINSDFLSNILFKSQKLEELNLVQLPQINKLPKQYTLLKKLTVDCENFLDTFNWTLLEELNIMRCDFSKAAVLKLLGAQHLKRLQLFACDVSEFPSYIDAPSHYSKLTKIEFDQCTLHYNFLCQIINTAPVEELMLSDCTILGLEGNDKKINLPNLNKLLIRNKTPSKILTDILQSGKIFSSEIPDLYRYLAVLPPDELERCQFGLSEPWMCFNGIKVVPHLLMKVLSSSQCSVLIEFKSCKGLNRLKTSDLERATIQWDNLKQIDFSFSDITESLLYFILKKAKNLDYYEAVNLKGCDHLALGLKKPCFKKYLNKLYNIPSNKRNNLHSKACDANTDPNDSPSEFLLTQIFYSQPGRPVPHPSAYRLNGYDLLVIKENVIASDESPFILDINSILVSDCEQPVWCATINDLIQARDNTSSIRHYGVITISLLPGEWEQLPSLSAHEKLTHIHVKGLTERDVAIRYDERRRFYYLRSAKRMIDTKIHFVIDVSPELDVIPESDLGKIVMRYRNFGIGALTHDKTERTGMDFIDAIEAQEVGACRHRAVALKAYCDKKYPNVYTQIITNDCHNYVEVVTEQGLIKCDLGGYPAHCEIVQDEDLILSDDIIMHALFPSISLNDKDEDNEKSKQSEKSELPYERMEAETDKLISQSDFSESSLNPDFITWKQNDQQELSPLECLEGNAQKYLIEISANGTLGYLNLLHTACVTQNRSLYYAHEPKDLICSARWIKRQNQRGILRFGPGGKCDRFINTAIGRPVIAVNFNNFTAEHIVQFNGLLDDPRIVDGTPIPDNVLVIGIHDPNRPDAYLGSDFYSRWDAKQSISQSIDELKPIEVREPPIDAHEINLYFSNHWKQLLLGKWELHGDQFTFKEGELAKALSTTSAIHLKNAPWHIEEFQFFWQQLLIAREIDIYGEILTLPREMTQTQSEGYDWETLTQSIVCNDSPSMDELTYTLNPTNLGHFLGTYEYDDHKLYVKQGWISSNSGKTLTIELTRNITKHQWALLLSTCQQYSVTLKMRGANWHILPDTMQARFKEDTLPLISSHAQTIITNDIDATIAKFMDHGLKARVFDISECKPSDILIKLDNTWNDDQITFSFNHQISDIWHALNDGETLILKGSFSPEMVDSLANLFLPNGYLAPPLIKSEHFGQLILISESEKLFPFVNCTHNRIKVKDKKDLLIKQFSVELVTALLFKLPNALKEYRFVKLQTLLLSLKNHPDRDLFSPWEGLTNLPISTPFSMESELDLSLPSCQAFEAERLAQIEEGLKNSSYLYIAGATGVGKSTFVENLQSEHCQIYHGLDEIEAFANDQSLNKTKVLFIDEANIGTNQYSVFEGLYQKPPTILVNGKIYTLSQSHKIIFAGNPLSYGGGRNLPSFFDRHGNTTLFGPMHPAYMYHKILKPLLNSGLDEESSMKLSTVFLKVYTKICNFPSNSVLITARELRTMALMGLSCPSSDPYQQAIHNAYYIGKSVLKDEQQQNEFTSWFTHTFPTFENPSKETKSRDLGSFLVTPSRNEAYQMLLAKLNIRSFQQYHAKDDSQRYGGLMGPIFEGEPGEGKSKFIFKFLKHFGFKRGNLSTDYLGQDKIYYYLPVSMPFSEKKALLLKAFNEGALVVIDEINSSPMMERLINKLSEGKYKGKRPLCPGFNIVGTQNPISFAGRRATTNASKRRFIHMIFENYPLNEIHDILEYKKLPSKNAYKLTQDYFVARKYAIKNQLRPLPTFRDLLRSAKKILLKILMEVDPVSSLNVEFTVQAPKASRKGRQDLSKCANSDTPSPKRRRITPPIS